MLGTHEVHARCPTIRSVMVRFDVIRTPDEAPSFTYSAMNRNCGLPSNMAIVCDLDSPGVATST